MTYSNFISALRAASRFIGRKIVLIDRQPGGYVLRTQDSDPWAALLAIVIFWPNITALDRRAECLSYSYLGPPLSGEAAGLFSLEDVWVTTYAMKYHGRRAKDGSVFDQNKLTCAVPRDRWNGLKGRTLRFHYKGQTVECLVTDTVGPKVRNFDLSRRAWTDLTRLAPSRVQATMEVKQ